MDRKNAERPQPEMLQVVERNIEALLLRKRKEQESKTFEERLADSVTRFTGSLKFVFVHLMFYGLWILVNVGTFSFLPRFDPSFVLLAMFASVEAIFLSTFVLISQNRMMAIADKRADLDLQISLLAEHEVTHVMKIVTDIAEKMGLEISQDPELRELSKDVHPEHVLDTMEKSEESL
jgi:uncharacterized membrane protein